MLKPLPHPLPHAWNNPSLMKIIGHLTAVSLSITGLVLLLQRAYCCADGATLAGCAVFGISLILHYVCCASSSLFPQYILTRRHTIPLETVTIYILIAGTFTPFALTPLSPIPHALLCLALWTIAGAGLLHAWLWQQHTEWMATPLQLLLGWVGLIIIGPLVSALPMTSLLWLLAGSIVYALAALLFSYNQQPYARLGWHTFIFIGSSCHYLVVFYYLAAPTYYMATLKTSDLPFYLGSHML